MGQAKAKTENKILFFPPLSGYPACLKKNPHNFTSLFLKPRQYCVLIQKMLHDFSISIYLDYKHDRNSVFSAVLTGVCTLQTTTCWRCEYYILDQRN